MQASILQSWVSYDPSEIILCWFAAQEMFIIISNAENSGAACTLKHKGASKGSLQRCIEEPFLFPQRTFSQRFFKEHRFLTFL